MSHLAAPPPIGLIRRVCFFGVVNLWLDEAVELYVRREDAENCSPSCSVTNATRRR